MAESAVRVRTQELRFVRAGDLKPHPLNWRDHPDRQRKALRGVVDDIGFGGALDVVERDGELLVLDGHARRDEFPDAKLPVLVHDFDDREALEYLASKDVVTEMYLANIGKQDALLRQVQTDNAVVHEMLAEAAANNGLYPYGGAPEVAEDPGAQIDRAEELREKWRTERGQLWEVGDHRLLCGDSTDAGDVGRVMGGERAALFATDPPYGVDYSALTASKGGKEYADIANDEDDGPKLQAWLEAVFTAWLPALADNSAWYLWHAQKTQGYFTAAAAAAGVIYHRQIVWVKPSLILGRGDYHWRHELCLYGWREGHRPQWLAGRDQDTVWEVASPHGDRAHPTEKPVELFARPIANHLQPGEITADPFLGSGTTMVAAEQLGRRCYALEIEPKYVAVALERMAGMGLEPRLSNG